MVHASHRRNRFRRSRSGVGSHRGSARAMRTRGRRRCCPAKIRRHGLPGTSSRLAASDSILARCSNPGDGRSRLAVMAMPLPVSWLQIFAVCCLDASSCFQLTPSVPSPSNRFRPVIAFGASASQHRWRARPDRARRIARESMQAAPLDAAGYRCASTWCQTASFDARHCASARRFPVDRSGTVISKRFFKTKTVGGFFSKVAAWLEGPSGS